jgi:hypothetical protein
MKTLPNVFYKSLCTFGMLQKKLSWVLKILCYDPRKWHETDVLAKTHLWTLLSADLPLVVLCIKLWWVCGGGTVRVTKWIILASVWASNSPLQRHLNGPKKARNVYPTIQKSMKTSPNVFYKESRHIRDVEQKLTLVLKIVCYSPRKWHDMEVFSHPR